MVISNVPFLPIKVSNSESTLTAIVMYRVKRDLDKNTLVHTVPFNTELYGR